MVCPWVHVGRGHDWSTDEETLATEWQTGNQEEEFCNRQMDEALWKVSSEKETHSTVWKLEQRISRQNEERSEYKRSVRCHDLSRKWRTGALTQKIQPRMKQHEALAVYEDIGRISEVRDGQLDDHYISPKAASSQNFNCQTLPAYRSKSFFPRTAINRGCEAKWEKQDSKWGHKE